MPQHTPARVRLCSACDGYASVKVTLGGRDRHGHLHTITAHCPTCHGTGTTTPARPRAAYARIGA
jgi:DnaJ-class molecular chaperone